MGGSSGGGVIPFMPSVFNGPYNAQGASQNEQALDQKFPWITPPAGQFEGAQPGQYAGAGTGTPAPSPPIPPTVQPSPQSAAQFNPAQTAQGQANPMQPTSLQAILNVLMGQNQTPATAGGQ